MRSASAASSCLFPWLIDSGLVGRKVFFIHEVSHVEKMLYSGTDPESYITEYTLAYEELGLGLRVEGLGLKV